MEVEILKEALDVARVKKPSLQLPSWNGRKDAHGRPLEPDRTGEPGRQADMGTRDTLKMIGLACLKRKRPFGDTAPRT
jgi:hypothetical protein